MELIASGALAVTWWILMFAAAGTIRWPAGWIYLAVLVVGLVSHRAFVGARNPETLVRRARIGAGTKRWDVAWLGIFWPLMVAAPVVAGIDTVRLGHRQLAAWHVAVGSILFGAGMAASAQAMAANPFFEGTARIQPVPAAVGDGLRPGAHGRGMDRGSHGAGGPDASSGAARLRALRRRVPWRLVPGLW